MLPKESELQFAASDAAHTLRPQLEEQLQYAAETAGWPERIVLGLSVDFDGTSLIVNYPDEIATDVENLEYGAEFKLPNPVIRPFIARSGGYIKDVLATVTLDDLIEMEEVF